MPRYKSNSTEAALKREYRDAARRYSSDPERRALYGFYVLTSAATDTNVRYSYTQLRGIATGLRQAVDEVAPSRSSSDTTAVTK